MRIASILLLLAAATAAQEPVDFNRDVRPILSDKCFHCHGPDARNRKAKLRLDTRAGAFAPRDDVTIIAPRQPEKSELLIRVLAEDEDDLMPPPESGRTLTTEQKGVLRRWIAQGAAWEDHWAFVAPRRPPLPTVGDPAWPRRPVDFFIARGLDRAGLSPSPPAVPARWVRRVTFDLTGLPPSPEEVDDFLQDTSAAGRARVVDRLLASPRYGEHMARFWLDAARYGDTHGLHLDNYREMWPYRDWVVAAFNDNMRYDDFVTWQLAGDMLEGATLEQRIASGFNRCHVTTNEGGSIDEEVYVRNVIDRTQTMGTVFMGLTIGCAVCHDHKFDPVSMEDFYGLFAFFNNLDGKAMDGNAKAHAPVVRVPTPEQTATLERITRDIADVEELVEVELARVGEIEASAPADGDEAAPRVETLWIDDALPEGATASGAELVWTDDRAVSGGRSIVVRASEGIVQTYFRNASRKLRFGNDDVLFVNVWIDPGDPPREIMVQFNNDGAEGWKHGAYWGENLIPYGKDGTTERRRLGDLPPSGRWVRLEIPARDVGLVRGTVAHGLAWNQHGGTVYWDALGIVSATPQHPEELVWIDDEAPAGAKKRGEAPHWQWVGGEDHPVLSGLRSLRRGGRGGLNQDFFEGAPPLVVQRGDVLFAHAWLDPKDPPKGIQLQFNDGSWDHRVRWGAPCHGPGRENGADFVASEKIPETGRWVRLEATLDQVGLKPGARLHGWAFTQTGGTVYWDRAGVKTWGDAQDLSRLPFDVWAARARGDGRLPGPVKKALAVDPAKRTPRQAEVARGHWIRRVWHGTREQFAPFETRLDALRDERRRTEEMIATTLVMKERAKPRPAHILKRGQYHAKGDVVERKTPSMLPPMAPELPRNRLGLARWLVDPAHPLTARVAVNRFWQQVFGHGLVRTSEDFGNQGERPSHPELLDWLAVRFIEDGWDVKRLMRRIVLSATYGQTSRVTEEHREKDPGNRLLARGPRYRLDAEMLRDQALMASGLLVEKLGGPGVKPPQPAGLWKAVGYVGSNTANFRQDEGADRVYRRSLYTFWKRTAPPPQMAAFDAPSREDCRMRRERTNTPLQALLLLNDPQYVEAARHLGRRALTTGGDTDAKRVSFAFRLLAAREPGEDDLHDLLGLLESQRRVFAADPGAAKRLISVGESKPDPELDPAELAAWTVVANLILNLDEVVTKG